MSSYRQILKSSSILGGSQAIGVILAMVTVKINAIYLGPQGTGLIGNFQSILNLAGAVATFGINTISIRQLTSFYINKNKECYSKTLLNLHILIFLLGIAALAVLVLCSDLISKITFNNYEYASSIRILGIILLFNNIYAAITADLQSKRKINSLALISIIQGVVSIPISFVLYKNYGISAVAPYLVISSLVQLIISLFFIDRCQFVLSNFKLNEFKLMSSDFIKSGVLLTLAGILTPTSIWIISSFVTNTSNVFTNGLYRTSFNLSAILISFILSAMAADYFPRLISVINDYRNATRVVTEQLEIGVLLATPCILGMMTFCPLLVKVFYSSAYLDAVTPLRMFLISSFLQIISWPLGYILLAKGSNKLFSLVEALTLIIYVIISLLGFKYYSILGLGIARIVLYIIYTIIMLAIAKKIVSFSIKEIPIYVNMCAIAVIASAYVGYLSDVYIYALYINLVVLTSFTLFSITKLLKIYNKKTIINL